MATTMPMPPRTMTPTLPRTPSSAELYASPLISGMLFHGASMASSSDIPTHAVAGDAAALRRALRASPSLTHLSPYPSSWSAASSRSPSRASSSDESGSPRPRAAGRMGFAAGSTESLPVIHSAPPHAGHMRPASAQPPPRVRNVPMLPPGAAPPRLRAGSTASLGPAPITTTSTTPAKRSKLSAPGSPADDDEQQPALKKPGFMRRVRSALDIRIRRRKDGAKAP